MDKLSQSEAASALSAPSAARQPGVEAPRRTFFDPLGRPMYQGMSSFTDQQAGGDLTGDESDARDDNFGDSGSGQHYRDVSARPQHLPSASADSQRYMTVVSVASAAASTVRDPLFPQIGEPDGTEDPGSNLDDLLTPARRSKTDSSHH